MQNFNIGNLKKGQGINIDQNFFHGGLKKTDNMSDAQKSIFDRVDKDKNGVIDNQELEQFLKSADTDSSGSVNWKEMKNFFKSDTENGGIDYTTTNDKGKTVKAKVTDKDIEEFLQAYLNDGSTEDIQNAQKTSVDGREAVQITYNNGNTEIIFDRESETSPTDIRTIITDAETGDNVTTDTTDGKKTRETILSQNGDMTVSEYEQDGQTLTRTESLTKETGKKEVVNYDDGKPSTKQVKLGVSTLNYEYDEQGNERIASKIENEGIPAKESHSEFKYNDDGTVTENITNAQGNTVRILNENGSIISEETKTTQGDEISIKYDSEGNKQTEVIKNSNGITEKQYNNGVLTTETVTSKDSKIVKGYDSNGQVSEETIIKGSDLNKPRSVTTNHYQNGTKVSVEYSEPGNKYSRKETYTKGHLTDAIITDNGKSYHARFDGHGHAKLVVPEGSGVYELERRTGISNKYLRTKCPQQDNKTNQQFVKSRDIYAGDVILVDQNAVLNMRGDKLSVLDINAASELDKGNAAEQRRQDAVTSLSHVYEDNIGLFGGYSNFRDLSVYLIREQGLESSPDLINKVTKKLEELNNGNIENKPLKIPATQNYFNMLSKVQNNTQNQQSQDSFLEGMADDIIISNSLLQVQELSDRGFEKLGNSLREASNFLGLGLGHLPTTAEINSDVKNYTQMFQIMQKAQQDGDFEEKFYQTFGIKYDKKNVDAYNSLRGKLERAFEIREAKEKASNAFDCYINQARATVGNMSQHLDRMIRDVREVGNLCFPENPELVEGYIQKMKDEFAGSKAPYEKQKESLNSIQSKLPGFFKTCMSNMDKQAHKELGTSYENYSSKLHAAAQAAFGSSSNIVERVDKYIAVQKTTGTVLRTATNVIKDATAAVTGGVGGMVVETVGTFAIETFDEAGSYDGITGNEFASICANSLAQGISHGVTNKLSALKSMRSLKGLQKYCAHAQISAIGATIEVLPEAVMKGEINGTTLFFDSVGSVVGMKYGNKIAKISPEDWVGIIGSGYKSATA